MASPPNVLVITARHEERVSADRVELLVTLKGASLVTGQAALQKAKEVVRLLDELATVGVSSSDVAIDGIHAEVTSGIFSKSSTASYHLRIMCKDLGALSEVLAVITSAKNAELGSMVWGYADLLPRERAWLEKSIELANRKAAAAAQALGTRVVGVHRMTESAIPSTPESYVVTLEAGAAPSVRRRYAEFPGLNLEHHATMGVAVSVEYLVEGFGIKQDELNH